MASLFGSAEPYGVELTVPVEYTDERGQTFLVTRTVRPWMAGADEKQLRAEGAEAQRRGAELSLIITGHKCWSGWREWGQIERTLIVAKASRLPAPLAEMVRAGPDSPVWEMEWRDVLFYVLNHVFDAHMTFDAGNELVSRDPGPALVRLVESRKRAWLEKAAEVLAVLGEPLDHWHQRTVLAVLIAPRLAAGLLSLGFWLQSAGPGTDPLLRLAGTATGAPDITERIAYRAKKDWHRRAGFARRPTKPGPKVGTERQPTPAQRTFDAYVGARRAAGVSPQALADDAEAARLYRTWKNDQGASLNEAIVRAALKRG